MTKVTILNTTLATITTLPLFSENRCIKQQLQWKLSYTPSWLFIPCWGVSGLMWLDKVLSARLMSWLWHPMDLVKQDVKKWTYMVMRENYCDRRLGLGQSELTNNNNKKNHACCVVLMLLLVLCSTICYSVSITEWCGSILLSSLAVS